MDRRKNNRCPDKNYCAKELITVHLKKIFSFLLAGMLAISVLPSAVAQEVSPPALQGTAACLMDADTGQVLYEKNMTTQLPPASITKIMTTLLGVEHGNWSDTLTMSYDAVFSVPRSASHIALQDGEVLTLEQALMATMLPSANDAANGVAEYVAGSMEAFADMMNQRAAECGAVSTHFVNANGLDAEGHITTAYDMALITKTAMQNPDFLRVFSTAEYVIPPTNKQTESRNIGAGHKMMFSFTKYYDEGIIGGKSGYTEDAGHTLVTAVKRNDRTLIAVVMGEPKNAAMYEDTVALFDYGFSAFIPITLSADTLSAGSTPSGGTEDLTVLVTQGTTLEDISLSYQVANSSAVDCTVQVSVSLGQENGLQYAKLGEQQLVYEAASETVSLPIETEKEKETPVLLRGLLFAARLCVAGVSILVFLSVFVMFYIRVSYELRQKKRRKSRRRIR